MRKLSSTCNLPKASPVIYACICDPGMFDVGTGECTAYASGSYKEQAADDDRDVAVCAACSENKTSVQGSSGIWSGGGGGAPPVFVGGSLSAASSLRGHRWLVPDAERPPRARTPEQG